MSKAKNVGGRKLVASSAKARGAAIILKKSKHVAASQEPVVDLTAKYEQRIAELMRERERLIGEAKLSCEGLESLRSELQVRSEQLADVMERLGITSQDNAVLVKLNSELQAKISAGEMLAEEARRVAGESRLSKEALESLRAELRKQSNQQRDLTERLDLMSLEKVALARRNEELRAKVSGLEARAKKADRLETELTVAHVALRQAGEELAKARETAEVESKAEMTEEALPMSPAKPEEKLEPSKISERVVPAVLAKWDVSDRTNEQFDKIRRSIVDKKNQKSNMTLLERFLVPFRDTPRIS